MSVGMTRSGLNIRGTRQNDTIEIRRAPTNPELLQVFENGKLTFQRNYTRIRQIRINTQAGDDSVSVNESYGEINARIIYQGGDGNDRFRGGSGINQFDGNRGLNVIYSNPTGQDRVRNAVESDQVRRFGSSEAFKDFLNQAGRNRSIIGGMIRRGEALRTPAAPISTPQTPSGALNDEVRALPLLSSGASQTNTQVAGIDEADIIENDGKHLYILSRGQLLIVDAQNANEPSLVSRTQIDGFALSEYLHNGRLTVISSVWNTPEPDSDSFLPALAIRGNGQVQITVFDVNNPASPSILSKTLIDGSYNESRMIDGKLVLVLQNDLLSGYWRGFVDSPRVIPSSGKMSSSPVSSSPVSSSTFSSLLKRTPVDRLIPGWSSLQFHSQGEPTARSGMVSRPEDILCPVVSNETNLMSVVLFDSTGTAPAITGSTSIVGSYASTIYANQTDLFIFSPLWDDPFGDRTGVQQFDIRGTSPQFLATGSFDGHLLNQFSADVAGDYLRVATTKWVANANRTDNAITVLKTIGSEIIPIGSLSGIAPGELITSVRFMEDRAYVVTFLQVDPLFVIDLSKPDSPEIAGELKIPGFSRYLQPYGEGYLIGIGRDADPVSGRTRGLKVSLFDVRNPNQPTETANFLLSEPSQGWSWSDAEWDHHALGYFPEINVIAVPVEGYIQTQPVELIDGIWFAPEYRSELVLLRVDPTHGIQYLGAVEHDSSLLRSSRINDVIYSVSDLDLKSVEILVNDLVDRGSVVLNNKTRNDYQDVIAF